ncbi:MAG: HlyD family secretion protein [Nitrospiraceae bacterium]|jgi:membrane fusion protein (multidrug efflux system)|nr:HlyD family secretion protein [Nitrospiraceae bacterium]
MKEMIAAANGKRKKIVLISFGSSLLIGAIALLFYLDYKATHITTDDAFVEGNIHTIAPKIPGTVVAVHVRDNQMVKKGDLLVELDEADYAARTTEGEAAVNAERGRLAEQSSRISARQANLKLQEANLRQAEIDLRRAEKLFQEEAISKERYEKTRTAYDVTVAQVQVAREELRQASSLLSAQSASIREKEARLKKAELDFSYTKLRAPTDGLVTKKNAEVGNQVQPGQALMAVVPLDAVWVVANFKETQLEKIRPGQKVEFAVDSYPGKQFTGRVDSIMAGTGAAFSLFPPQNATGNYVKIVQRVPVKIIIDKNSDPDHLLRVGMSVLPTVKTSEK